MLPSLNVAEKNWNQNPNDITITEGGGVTAYNTHVLQRNKLKQLPENGFKSQLNYFSFTCRYMASIIIQLYEYANVQHVAQEYGQQNASKNQMNESTPSNELDKQNFNEVCKNGKRFLNRGKSSAIFLL